MGAQAAYWLTRTLIPRAEVEVLLKALNDKLDGAILRLDKFENIGIGSRNTWGYIVGIFGLLVAGITLISRLFTK